MICIWNGELKPAEAVALPIDDLAVLRGYGIFDFFRLSGGVPLFIDDHLDRFYRSASFVRIPVRQTRDELKALIFEQIRINNMPESGIRLVLTGGAGAGAYSIGSPNLIVTQEAIAFPPEAAYHNGVKLITYDYLREIPQVKTINYMTGIWLKPEIARQDAYDVVYVHDHKIHELTRSNIFIVNESGTLVTPAENVLMGVTRKHILKACAGVISVEERPITKEELYAAEEVFVSGTTKRVLPITAVDHVIYGNGKPGPVTLDIMKRFARVEAEYVAQGI